jgi:hypothetical protein
LDKLGESTPFFWAAVRRLIGEQAEIAIDGIETMIKLARVRRNKKAEKGITKILADFRKTRRKPIYKPVNSMRRTLANARVG